MAMKRGTAISGVALPIAHGSYALELEPNARWLPASVSTRIISGRRMRRENDLRGCAASDVREGIIVLAVMLHLRACYVSKAAILPVPVQTCRSKIEVPLEFQGFGSLGAASWRRFFPCEFDIN
jgi:hypothetical protein